MQSSPAITASSRFLEEVWTGDPPSVARLIELLDRLLVSYHDTICDEVPRYECDPREMEWRSRYEVVGQRFPAFGLYPIADPMDAGAATLMMGDAIDDIADITSDLRTVIWNAENHSTAYADAAFIDLYSHWGRHARELLLLLHASEYG